MYSCYQKKKKEEKFLVFQWPFINILDLFHLESYSFVLKFISDTKRFKIKESIKMEKNKNFKTSIF